MTAITNEPSVDQAGELFDLAQRCHHLVETLHVVVYFAPEPAQEYAAFGLRGRPAYFASRAAALGPVPGPVVAATFGVFDPDFVARAFPMAWNAATPAQWLDARHRGVGAALHRVLGGQPDVGAALDLARTATSALQVQGRALYAACTALPWPEDPLMALWHAATLLREHRGDGHMATLAVTGMDPLEAIIVHGIASRTIEFQRTTRGWSESDWAAAVRRLQDRGLLDRRDPPQITEVGRNRRRDIENLTRTAALAGWTRLGVDGCRELIERLTPIREQLMASDVFPPGSPLKPTGEPEPGER